MTFLYTVLCMLMKCIPISWFIVRRLFVKGLYDADLNVIFFDK